MKEVLFTIKENRPLSPSVCRLVLQGDVSAITRPGQFLNIRVDGAFLRRPLSVMDVEGDSVSVAYKIIGRGTELLSRQSEGETLNVLTGLGNGFSPENSGDAPLLVGGGMGFTPLYFLAKCLTALGRRPTVLLGFGSAEDVLYEREFSALCPTIVVTADGSAGRKGLVTDVMKDLPYSYFYACGPEPMFAAMNDIAVTEGEFSYEARMGCGFGACMGCTCSTIAGPKRICRDGPVLKRSEIRWQT